jgi:hypothetical protein
MVTALKGRGGQRRTGEKQRERQAAKKRGHREGEMTASRYQIKRLIVVQTAGRKGCGTGRGKNLEQAGKVKNEEKKRKKTNRNLEKGQERIEGVKFSGECFTFLQPGHFRSAIFLLE